MTKVEESSLVANVPKNATGSYDHVKTSLQMASLWPALFTPGQYKPIAIRLNGHMIKDLKKRGYTAGVKFNRFLAIWTKEKGYLEAIAAGGPRYALDGSVMGRVSKANQNHAAVKLKALQSATKS